MAITHSTTEPIVHPMGYHVRQCCPLDLAMQGRFFDESLREYKHIYTKKDRMYKCMNVLYQVCMHYMPI